MLLLFVFISIPEIAPWLQWKTLHKTSFIDINELGCV